MCTGACRFGVSVSGMWRPCMALDLPNTGALFITNTVLGFLIVSRV